MQCVILAAGKGTRMRPLTEEKPKPLVEVAEVPLIEHVVRNLPEQIEELVIVIGYEGEQLQKYCGDEFYDRPVEYVWQDEKAGTAHALFSAADHLGEQFLVVNADDLLGQDPLAEAITHDLCMLTYHHEHPERFGVVDLDDERYVSDIVEKPDNPPSNYVSTGAVSLDERIFSYELPEKMDGEHYLSDLLKQLAGDHSMHVVEDPHWYPVGYPEDIPKAEAFLQDMKEK